MSDILCIRCGVFPVPTKYVICEQCTLDRPMLQRDQATGTVSVVGRDPALRKAALEALVAFRVAAYDIVPPELDAAMNALQAELAK